MMLNGPANATEDSILRENRMMLRYLFLFALALPLSAAGTCLAHTADKPVQDVYIRRDWAANVLPELIAQLQVPAIIELGKLEPIPQPPDEYTRKWLAPREIVPERAVETFSFRGGTAGQALDAFCRENPNFEWREQNGVIILRRRSGHPPGYISPLDFIVSLDVPLADAHVGVAKLGLAMREEFERRGLPPMITIHPLNEDELASLWQPRCDWHYPLAFRLDGATVRDAVIQILKAQPNHFWISLEQEPRQGTGPFYDKGAPRLSWGDRWLMIFTNWSPVRGMASVDDLIKLANPSEPELHEYETLALRVEDAQRELHRRAHFQPEAISAALRNPEHTGVWGLVEGYHKAFIAGVKHHISLQPILELVLDMGDEEASRIIADYILQEAETPAHPWAPGRLRAALPGTHHRHVEWALPYWRKIAAKETERFTQAKGTLQWYGEYQEYLASKKLAH